MLQNTQPVDINKIISRLPHRYPFLMIDRIISMRNDVNGMHVKAIKNVTNNDSVIPAGSNLSTVFPAVLIIESMAQATIFLAQHILGETHSDEVYYFAAINRARFYHAVYPGDQLYLDVSFIRKRGRIIQLAGVATVLDKRVCTATFMCVRA
ncbi:3-hydroxyacyl-ACP dehydratase FabZ [Acerihabitans sp. TG2]|uniref:3-hydroxyacyl-ACP dehydratase FabZ n=1 Tax=Acerihabitans sp. TG2 TaxID=3096008 RepID=UPI002B2326A2|nr:3-hydroxyacyl-ACP dehydratase FabZ [Acerihabitans sp. TG2]MEA9392128.1 3-hydroxyacyl-ACP dehydratase FabZ [Acerihabitans sp. TG2]